MRTGSPPGALRPQLTMVRGGGSRPDGLKDGSSVNAVRSRRTAFLSSGVADAILSGSRAAAAEIGHAGVQQSILERSAGLAGMCSPIVQPGIVPAAAIAPEAARGLSASPIAHRKKIKRRITRSKYRLEIKRVKLGSCCSADGQD